MDAGARALAEEEVARESTSRGEEKVAPKYALTQAVVKVRMRAQAAAVMMLCTNLVGLGLGPQAVGLLSDFFSTRYEERLLRYALLVVAVFNVLAAVCYLLAAQSVRSDIASRDVE